MRAISTYIALLIIGFTVPSCVSYLPPSSLHHDMLQNRHPVITDSVVDQSQILYGNIHKFESGYHHRRDPEMEDNKAWGIQGGYGYSERKQSVGLSAGYSTGHMIDDDGNRYHHSNLMFKGSYAYDFHSGRWNGHIVKLQGAASKGFGRYQNVLAENYPNRDEYNLAISDNKWLYSIGYGSQFYYDFKGPHDLGLGLFFNYSTDFDKDGFHSEFFNMELDYLFQDKYRVNLGGMLDARFTPRGETLYLGLGYEFKF